MLSKKQIDELAEEGVFLGNIYEITQAIETEVRKQDDALILQLVEALEYSSPNTNVTYAWQDDCWALKRSRAIIAGRARLGEKT